MPFTQRTLCEANLVGRYVSKEVLQLVQLSEMAEESSSNVQVTNCCDDCFYCISLLTVQYKTSLWNVNILNEPSK